MTRATGDRNGVDGDVRDRVRASRARALTSFMTGADRLVLYALVGVGLVLMFAPRAPSAGAVAVVEGPDGWSRVMPLGADATIDVEGPLGTTTVVVSGGEVRIASSPCPNHTCVATGPVARPGESTVCVPNGVVVRVLGRGSTDAMTR